MPSASQPALHSNVTHTSGTDAEHEWPVLPSMDAVDPVSKTKKKSTQPSGEASKHDESKKTP